MSQLNESSPTAPLAAIVVNPTKLKDQAVVRAEVTQACKDAGWQEPMWLETTREDPGYGQTKQAVEAGASIVFAAGGDGTVRMVGSALAETEIPLGLMPAGTGNLLARNLKVPFADTAGETFARSLDGDDVIIDVGRIRATYDDGSTVEDTYLIMAGFGLDGDIMDSTSETLKKAIGWMAYPLSGVQYFWQRPEHMIATFDDGAPRTRKTTSLLLGNCGRLTGGVHLMPDAQPDDSILDVVWLSADGPKEWASLTRSIMTNSRKNTAHVDRYRVHRVTAKALGAPRPLELDGDVIGRPREIHSWIEPLALHVRTTAPIKRSLSRKAVDGVRSVLPHSLRRSTLPPALQRLSK